MLAFARQQSLKPEVFDAVERVHAVTEVVGAIIGAWIAIVTEFACASCFVRADVSEFETGLVNMVVNARVAMDREDTLKMWLHEASAIPSIRDLQAASGALVAVSVADTGTGIPVDKLG